MAGKRKNGVTKMGIVRSTFVIDKKGMIRYKHTGPVYQEDIADKILPMIEQLKAES